jgi:hypothetical protein
METKKYLLMAAMLLTSVCMFAQSNNEPLKGDVNEDGKVDVADIVAVVEIIQNGGGTSDETTYYWYAGQTAPTSMSSNPTVDDTNFTNNKWHTLGSATQIDQTIKGGTAGTNWKIAVPTSKGFTPYASDLTTPETSWDKITTITINNVSYDVWQTYSTGAKVNVYMK